MPTKVNLEEDNPSSSGEEVVTDVERMGRGATEAMVECVCAVPGVSHLIVHPARFARPKSEESWEGPSPCIDAVERIAGAAGLAVTWEGEIEYCNR